nr:zinc finger C2HC domain-containing protein 1B-like [Lytechinus pictus]
MSRPGSMRKRRGIDASPSSKSTQGLEPCHTCGRTFLPDVLARHLQICAKVFNSKRRVFESGRQRIAGTGISITKIVRPDKIKKQGIKKTNWRQNHADFVNAIRSARQAQHAINTGKPLPPPPPPSINPNYIQCPHCGRRFNQTAAARHINFCVCAFAFDWFWRMHGCSGPCR